jgi:hypothetical protein
MRCAARWPDASVFDAQFVNGDNDMSLATLRINSLFDRLTRRSGRVRQFDALWSLDDAELRARGLKRQSLAMLLFADTGLS